MNEKDVRETQIDKKKIQEVENLFKQWQNDAIVIYDK